MLHLLQIICNNGTNITEVGKRNACCLVVHARDCQSSPPKMQWHSDADTLAEKTLFIPRWGHFNLHPLYLSTHLSRSGKAATKHCRHCDHDTTVTTKLSKKKKKKTRARHISLCLSVERAVQASSCAVSRVFWSLGEVRGAVWLGPSIGSLGGVIYPLLNEQKHLHISWRGLRRDRIHLPSSAEALFL